MTTPISPLLKKGGLAQVDADNGQLLRLINFQFNPETFSRSLQVLRVESGDSNRAEALRLKGPAAETINLEVEFDTADQREFPQENPDAVEFGLYPQLAALETLIYPSSSQLQANHRLAQAGTLEITPMQAPLLLFIWGKQRILPVNLTEFSVTEEAFDSFLNPVRAKVSLGMRVLSIFDIPVESYGGGLFMSYLEQKEQFATKIPRGSFSISGIGGLP
ncbi:MAG: hypothetical protein AAGI69_05830 [Cyanobacteria bacterium P01_H01_bin.21]